MKNKADFKIKGMQRDLSVSTFNPEYAYENMNIRITPTEDNTLLSITNEKGPQKLITLSGIPVGQCKLNDFLILFTHAETTDYIYKIYFDENDSIKFDLLLDDDINLNPKHPIETLSVYENENIQKVYFTDGYNQPRVINIAQPETIGTKLDFVRDITSDTHTIPKFSISRDSSKYGEFPAGVIQYIITYVDYNISESNIIYQSELQNISFDDRGGSPEDKINLVFNIKIYGNTLSNNFEYIRIYSILRTSVNSDPIVKRIRDLNISEIKKYSVFDFYDDGIIGEIEDPTKLFFIGGKRITAYSIQQKDNTLFLGNIQIKESQDIDLKKQLKDLVKQFGNRIVQNGNIQSQDIRLYSDYTNTYNRYSGYYSYDNSLKHQYNKFFKLGEYYRLGIQFKNNFGELSEVFYITDIKIDNSGYEQSVYPFWQSTVAVNTIDINIPQEIITLAKKLEFISIRPVIVYPTISDREIIGQGLLCPTVFNLKDRCNGIPFVQSSWFARPFAPFDIDSVVSNNASSFTDLWKPLGIGNTTSNIFSQYSKGGIITNKKTTMKWNNDLETVFNMPEKGAVAEFRHYKPLPNNNQRNCEIQCNYGVSSGLWKLKDADPSNILKEQSTTFYVDQSILTFHSPDIEFDDNIKNYSFEDDNVNLRIVGFIPITSNMSDIDIQTSTSPNVLGNTTSIAYGFYNPDNMDIKHDKISDVQDYYQSHFGYRGLISGPFWFDDYAKTDAVGYFTPDGKNKAFVVYPWHRTGSLSNGNNNTTNASMLKQKRMSNLRFSFNTQYFTNNIGYNYYEFNNGIQAKLFNSDQVTALKIKEPLNSNLGDIIYYGNIDTLITPTKKYPLVRTDKDDSSSYIDMFNANYTPLTNNDNEMLTSPIRMRYKSTPHVVVALNYDNTGDSKHSYGITLPNIYDVLYRYDISSPNHIDLTSESTIVINRGNIDIPENNYYLWDKQNKISGFRDTVIDNKTLNNYNMCGPVTSSQMRMITPQHGYFWIGELYRTNIINRFGGDSDEAILNNKWIIAGNEVLLNSGNDNHIYYTNGDTYYQRYDCLKTYPFSFDDINQITDIVSFMCFTHINIDGRYDKNRGLKSNLVYSPENYNKINPIYNQDNNFFTYRTKDYNKAEHYNYNNLITWTKTKSLGEIVDSWTNISLASTLEMDGNLGEIRAIKKFNNDLFVFQDNGISQLLYNESYTIPTTSGVPIEIANSGKVNGKRYISNKIGCTNKWSIVETPLGIYFTDSNSKGIYKFNGQLDCISESLGFKSWAYNKINNNIWDLQDFNSIVTYYDNVNKDVLFIDKYDCLAYSESLGQFTSFYSYNNIPYFINIKDKGFFIKNDSTNTESEIWQQHKGNYNDFFGVRQPYYTTVIINPNPKTDKIFNNLEFRADSWDILGNLKKQRFTHLETWNEYQKGKIAFDNINLRQKFRIWRANIPRNNIGIKGCDLKYRDRMRNPWLYLKLSSEGTDYDKTILHDLSVYYFE